MGAQVLLCLQAEAGASPVTEAITAAVRESGGRALGGKAVFVPLLERCRTETTVQIARMPHPTLPSLRAQLTVPRLRFFVSAARVRRLMRVLRSALPGQPSQTDVHGPEQHLLHSFHHAHYMNAWASMRCMPHMCVTPEPCTDVFM